MNSLFSTAFPLPWIYVI